MTKSIAFTYYISYSIKRCTSYQYRSGGGSVLKPMLLCIDSGNTNIVFAVFDDEDKTRGQWRSSSHGERTADEFGVWLGQLMDQAGITAADITACIIASVVPASLYGLKTLCRDYFACDPLVIGEKGVDLGIGVLVDRPDDVGADRLVNAVSAHQLYGGPLIIVDFGTATTFDIIDAAGNYVGGVIAPGVDSLPGRDSLQRSAEQRAGLARTSHQPSARQGSSDPHRAPPPCRASRSARGKLK